MGSAKYQRLVDVALADSMRRPTGSTQYGVSVTESLLEQFGANRPIVIAHRGASSEAPENTLAAFRAAISAGAQFIEFDYHHTSDAVPIVIHDELLDRTTNACELWGRSKVAVADTSLPLIRQLDAGAWYRPEFRGELVPTLDEALGCIAPRAVPVIEHKSGDPTTLINLLTAKNMRSAAVVMSFDWSFVRTCRTLAPELVLVALGDGALNGDHLSEALRASSGIVGWNEEYLNQNSISMLQSFPGKVWVYTVDNEVRARQLLKWGVQGIITNRVRTMLHGLATS